MKSETKFTPGPWSLAHFARRSAKCKCGYVLVEGYMGAVATVHASCVATGADYEHGDNPPMKEAKANARLIAAAPEMYKALAQAKEFIENQQLPDAEWERVLDVVVAALAKAVRP